MINIGFIKGNGYDISENGICTVYENISEIDSSHRDFIRHVEFSGIVSKINTRLFTSCKNLRTVTIPPNINFIGALAFVSCEKLETVYIESINPVIKLGVFSNCHNLKLIYCTESVKEKLIGLNSFERDVDELFITE